MTAATLPPIGAGTCDDCGESGLRVDYCTAEAGCLWEVCAECADDEGRCTECADRAADAAFDRRERD